MNCETKYCDTCGETRYTTIKAIKRQYNYKKPKFCECHCTLCAKKTNGNFLCISCENTCMFCNQKLNWTVL